ncbi:hypothetical protein PR202_ga27929 [Eleusine coracana subsp. coracana]|uniref:Structure-specific endonuclease subunit SLX1 homolog n=1 Tax=Eleusine coracana subsp. coracana TaxID=191504 RepID=A0AAV5DI37_ELECO|nr:hypothetical protein PR202_ga27929 [Eleusine coracana subsp. coracana]
MARRAVGRVTRRPRKPSAPSPAAGGEDGAAEDARPQAPPAKRPGAGGGFFCCYLLRSMCPRLKGRTYIGFTVNPRRRIRQHNGEISSGAWRTRKGRPWEMVLCIYGFPTNVAALQFEWAWQHPRESLAVREAASNFKSLSGAGTKVKLAYAMLNLPSWENHGSCLCRMQCFCVISLNLTVNFFSSTSTKFAASCPPLPSQMETVICPMEDLQCNTEAIREEQGPSSEVNQGPESLHRVEHSSEQLSMDVQTRTAEYNVDEDDYTSDDLALMEWDGILDLTEPDGSRYRPNVPSAPVVMTALHLKKTTSMRTLRPIKDHKIVLPETSILGSNRPLINCSQRTNKQDLQSMKCRRTVAPVMNVDGDGDVIEDEVGHVSPVWKVSAGSADGGDDGVVDDEFAQTSTTLMLNTGCDSDCGDSGVTNDELGQASPMLMVDVGIDKGERDVVVDLVTPTPVGRLWRRAGADNICPRIIDLTASPVVIEL